MAKGYRNIKARARSHMHERGGVTLRLLVAISAPRHLHCGKPKGDQTKKKPSEEG
ncbi:hypothetical protein CS8_084650 [Cupriavidus sp. 8B]